MKEDEIKTGRILYKISVGGEYEYSLLFSNIIDSTYSDGAWLYKAKQAELVFVCFGVNDILQGFSEEQIKKDLKTIVDTPILRAVQFGRTKCISR